MATYNGQVTGGGLNLRASDTTSSSALVQIPNNTQIVVSDYSGNTSWYCTTYSGKSGFVMKQYVNILGNVASRSCAVTGGGLNLRAYPSTSAPSPVQIPNGTALTVQTHNDNWSSTTFQTYRGFVMTQYLTNTSSGTAEYSISAEVDTDKHGDGGYLNMRASASESAGKVTTIPDGATIYVKSVSGTWLEAKYKNYTGYVMAKFVMGTAAYGESGSSGGSTTLPTSGLFYARVTTSGSTLYMRKGAGTGYDTWYAVPNHRIVLCEEITASGWYKTRFKGQPAYLSGDYMTRLTTPTVHSNYIDRCKYLYTPELNRTSASYYDGASSDWCQYFVNWLLRAAYVPSSRVPTTGSTGWGIAFFVKNTNDNGGRFYFKSAEHKKRINIETSRGYNLNVGNTLTAGEIAYVPSEGDLIYLRWDSADSSTNVSHTGFVRNVSGNTVYTVEGNAGKPACVRERSYSLSDPQIVGYAKPNYSA